MRFLIAFRSSARGVTVWLFAWGAALVASSAQAGVFNLPHFVAPGDFALGLEPELTLSSGAGVGINAKYTQGLTDLNNFTAILGTGSGPRRFRAGGNFTFDFFPDLEGQPGIGIAAQGLYVRLKDRGAMELTAIPYLHKSFVTGTNEVEPYLAVPFGFSFSNGNYNPISSVVVGSLFKSNEHFRYVVEFGIAVNRTDSYISGGFVFYK